MVEQKTGLTFPAGSQGLNMYYKGEPMDPFFIAKVEIPAGSQEETIGRIKQLKNQDIHESGSPAKEYDWWKLSKETTKAECRFADNRGTYVHIALCNEDGHWIVYLEWFT